MKNSNNIITEFKSKAKTLESLIPIIKDAYILPILRFNTIEYKKNEEQIVKSIQTKFDSEIIFSFRMLNTLLISFSFFISFKSDFRFKKALYLNSCLFLIVARNIFSPSIFLESKFVMLPSANSSIILSDSK